MITSRHIRANAQAVTPTLPTYLPLPFTIRLGAKYSASSINNVSGPARPFRSLSVLRLFTLYADLLGSEY